MHECFSKKGLQNGELITWKERPTQLAVLTSSYLNASTGRTMTASLSYCKAGSATRALMSF